MLHRSNGLIWYSARCWLLFWYARQSVLMEDDCSRVWRQFDGLWMRAHSVPLTAQDNALCSLLPLSQNHTQHNIPQWTAPHNISIYTLVLLLLYKTARHQILFLTVLQNSCSKTLSVCFQKLLFLEMNRLGLFIICAALETVAHCLCAAQELKEDHI